MGLIGSKVPMVRCRFHEPALNLAFDGAVYESPSYWENMFTNKVSQAELTPARIFASAAPSADKPATTDSPLGRKYPPRDPKTPKQLLDLSKFYNAMLNESWHGGTDNQLQGLPAGTQYLAGVNFDLRGIIQLGARTAGGTNYPTEAKGIQVRQKCQRVFFLHAAAWGRNNDEGRQIGSYVVHFATNQMQLEIPIIYGRSVRDWHSWPSEPPAPKELTLAWKGENGVSKRGNASIRLFMTTWNNVVPDLEIESLDFVSGMTNAAPFLLAVTVE
jgi:hypothetical protein